MDLDDLHGDAKISFGSKMLDMLRFFRVIRLVLSRLMVLVIQHVLQATQRDDGGETCSPSMTITCLKPLIQQLQFVIQSNRHPPVSRDTVVKLRVTVKKGYSGEVMCPPLSRGIVVKLRVHR